jgi:acetyltransferase
MPAIVPQLGNITLDPAHDILRYQSHPLDAIFRPGNVAVIGATEKPGSVGRTIMRNLISNSFGGAIFPVNPGRPSVMGIKAYKTIADIPDPVDLAIIVTPSGSVPGLVQQCAEAGVKGVIVISAGFKEVGPEGAALEQQILEIARKAQMRIVGPNCLGVMNPLSGLNATFAGDMALKGNVAFISQSGALCTAVLDWSLQANVGFSAFVSIGSMLDVDWGDLITYLGNDPNTHSIVLYMESIGNAQSFLSAAREVAQSKPIIVIKPGRTEAASKAAASHTGSLTGSDAVLEAAFERVGVLRVEEIADLFAMADILSKQPRPQGPRLTILTNAGGPGVLATDALVEAGSELAELSPETLDKLNGFLPPHWSHGNPVDILGDAGADRYAEALEVAVQDENSDGMLVILTPQDMSDPTPTAEMLAPFAQKFNKPILASWMGGAIVAEGQRILNQAGIPTYDYPDKAARTFAKMVKYADNLRALYQTPTSSGAAFQPFSKQQQITEFLRKIRNEGRTLLTEAESKQLLTMAGIPTVRTEIAITEEAAVALAKEIGFPVVLKLHSYTITHKTDVGGVKLNLGTEDMVRDAFRSIRDNVARLHSLDEFQGVTVQPMAKLDGYELILGASLDPQFGPVLMFGMGGQLVEVFKDTALGLPPLNSNLAMRMIEKTRISHALKGVRGRKPIDQQALAECLVGFSQLVAEQPLIAELDINPLLASPDKLIALDARVVLHDLTLPEAELPKPAIRPYPVQYIWETQAKNGTDITIRPIRAEDEDALRVFHHSLSDRTVYLRFMQAFDLNERTTHARLARICFTDYNREIALATEVKADGSQRRIVGVSRLSRLYHSELEAEFRMLVSDDWQGQGLGKELVRRTIDVARQEGVHKLVAHILKENQQMLHMCESLGFRIEASEPMQNNPLSIVRVVLDL